MGVYAPGEPVADLAYLALFALQHRGQESSGLAVTDGRQLDAAKGPGLMTEAFRDRRPDLAGHAAVGHVRYSSAALHSSIQPIFAYGHGGFLCLAHNGNLVNAPVLRTGLERSGCIFQTSTDSEIILNLIARFQGPTLEDRVKGSLAQLEGAYSLVLMTGQTLIGARDPHGFRPLCLGALKGVGGYALASESCALDAIEADFLRDVAPGELVVIDQGGLRYESIGGPPARRAACIFEYVYFARPDSVLDGLSVWQARYNMGRRLAREFKVSADLVAPVPDTGISAALGFSAESGLPYLEGLIKNRYVGRTFILPNQARRRGAVDMKFNTIRSNLLGRRVVLVDDSLVRGTTSAQLVAKLRRAGAGEIHFCLSSPPITHPCCYGIDTSVRRELAAAVKSVEEIRAFLKADSLHYLSRAGLLEAVDDPGEERMCTACFSGEYPTPVYGAFDDEGS